ncbi:hypothetical protein K25_01425, partial [Klebsiella pneumoniae]
KKLGQKEVKIPALDKNGVQHGWKTAHRNEWQLENLGVKGIDRISSSSKELVLNSAEMIKKQQLQMKFLANKTVDDSKRTESENRNSFRIIHTLR